MILVHLVILLQSSFLPRPMAIPPQPVPHFIYVYDPLCGWCYGFSPVIMELEETFRDRATFEVIAGGMVRGDRVGPLLDIAPYLREAYLTVEETTGIRFGQPYLDELFGEADMIMDSEPGCLVQTAVNLLQPDLAIPFAHEIQKSIYARGIPPSDRRSWVELAVTLGIDRQRISDLLSDDQTYQDMINGFSRSEGMGVRGFPTLLMEVEDQRYIITRGYAPWPAVEARIDEVLSALPRD